MAWANNLKIHGLAGEFSEIDEESKEPLKTEVRTTDDAEDHKELVQYGRNTISDQQEKDPKKIKDLDFDDTFEMMKVSEYVEE